MQFETAYYDGTGAASYSMFNTCAFLSDYGITLFMPYAGFANITAWYGFLDDQQINSVAYQFDW